MQTPRKFDKILAQTLIWGSSISLFLSFPSSIADSPKVSAMGGRWAAWSIAALSIGLVLYIFSTLSSKELHEKRGLEKTLGIAKLILAFILIIGFAVFFFGIAFNPNFR